MQQEFYIGQKVKTSQVGIEKGCSDMQGVITKEGKWNGETAFYVTNIYGGEGLCLPEEIEPIEDSVPHVVFENITGILQ